MAKIKEIIVNIFSILAMSAIVCGLTYYTNRPVTEVLRNTVTFVWGGAAVFFLWYQSAGNHTLEYDNGGHPYRFLLVLWISYIISLLMILLPVSGWVFLSLMVVLAMFSNSITGLTAGSLFLLTTCSLTEGTTMYTFFLYFMIGLIGVALFQHLDLEFHVAGPLFLAAISSFVLQTAYVVIFENQSLQFEIILMPMLNLFINMAFLFLILKYFSRIAMYLLQDKYAEINDQEFPLMTELKKNNQEQYYEAIHTAYLAERIARKIGINDEVVKGCCYYYKMAKNQIKTEDGELMLLSEYYEFPEDLKAAMEECMQGKYGSKESCVVLTSAKIIGGITKLQQEYIEKEIPYENYISKVFENMIHSSLLFGCDISMKDLKVMETTFREEKLYYDFLRR